VYEQRGELKPAGGAVKHELIERHRRTLTRRLELVLNSRRERKKTSNAQLSRSWWTSCCTRCSHEPRPVHRALRACFAMAQNHRTVTARKDNMQRASWLWLFVWSGMFW
jgi:hypothetical protein